MKKVLCVLGSAIYSCGISYLVYLFIKWFSEARIFSDFGWHSFLFIKWFSGPNISSGWHIFLSVILIFVFAILAWLFSYPLVKMAKFAFGCAVVSFIPSFCCLWFTAIYPWFFHSDALIGNKYILLALLIDIAVATFFVLMWGRTAKEAGMVLGPISDRGADDVLIYPNTGLMCIIIFIGCVFCFREDDDVPVALFSVAGFIIFLTPLITSLIQKRLRKEIEMDMVCLSDEKTEAGRERNRVYIEKYSTVFRFFIGFLIISIAVGICISVDVYFSFLTYNIKDGWYWFEPFPEFWFFIAAWIVPMYFILNIINIPSLWGHIIRLLIRNCSSNK